MNPTTNPETETAVFPGRARFAERALARLIDVIFLVMTVMVFSPALAGSSSRMVGRELPLVEKFIPSLADMGFLFLMFFAAGVAFHTLMTWLHGATPAKILVGVVVRRSDGRSPGFMPSFIRSAAMLVDGFLFGAVGHFVMSRSPLNQRLGDRWADTVALKGRDWRPLVLLRLGVVFLLSLVTAVLAAAAISLLQTLYDYYVVGLYG